MVHVELSVSFVFCGNLNEEPKDSQIEYGDSCGFFKNLFRVYIFVYKYAVCGLWHVGWCDCLGVCVEVRHLVGSEDERGHQTASQVPFTRWALCPASGVYKDQWPPTCVLTGWTVPLSTMLRSYRVSPVSNTAFPRRKALCSPVMTPPAACHLHQFINGDNNSQTCEK